MTRPRSSSAPTKRPKRATTTKKPVSGVDRAGSTSSSGSTPDRSPASTGPSWHRAAPSATAPRTSGSGLSTPTASPSLQKTKRTTPEPAARRDGTAAAEAHDQARTDATAARKTGFAARFAAALQKISRGVTIRVDVNFNVTAVQRAAESKVEPSKPPPSPDGGDDPRLRDLDEMVRRFMEESAAAQMGAAARVRFAAAVLGVSAAEVGQLDAVADTTLEGLRARLSGQAVRNAGLPPDLVTLLGLAARTWNSTPEPDFWADIAAVARPVRNASFEAFLREQAAWMGIVAQLSNPGPPPVVWRSGAEKAQLIDLLMRMASGSVDPVQAILTTLPTLVPASGPLPRAVAAEVAQIVLAALNGRVPPGGAGAPPPPATPAPQMAPREGGAGGGQVGPTPAARAAGGPAAHQGTTGPTAGSAGALGSLAQLGGSATPPQTAPPGPPPPQPAPREGGAGGGQVGPTPGLPAASSSAQPSPAGQQAAPGALGTIGAASAGSASSPPAQLPAVAMASLRKVAVRSGKTMPHPLSDGGMRNTLWDDLAEWQALDSIRGAAGDAAVPAAVIARDLAQGQGGQAPVVDRLVNAATAFDVLSGGTPPPDPAVLAQAADDLRYAVMDVWSAPELRPPLTPERQQLVARASQVGDLLMLTAADALRRAQKYPGDSHDLLTWEIRQLLGGLSTRPVPLNGELRQEWDKSDYLRRIRYTPSGQNQPVPLGVALEELDGFVRARDRLSTWTLASDVMPVLLASRQRVLDPEWGIPVEDQATVIAEIDSMAMAVEALLGPEIGILMPSAADVRAARTARTAAAATSPSQALPPGYYTAGDLHAARQALAAEQTAASPSQNPGLPPGVISAGEIWAAREKQAAAQAWSSARAPGSPPTGAKPMGLPSAAAMGVNRKAAAVAGKVPPVPGSSADMRNKVWDDLQEWSVLDSARSAAGGVLPAATIAWGVRPAQGRPSPDVDRLVSAATAFDVAAGRTPPDPAALARAADDLRYAVKDTQTAPELQPPLTPQKRRLIAMTAQAGDKLLLTAADALRRVQVHPGDSADPLTSGIRDLLAELSTRPGPPTGALRQEWDRSDFLRTYTYLPTGQDAAVSVGAVLGELDRVFLAGTRDAIRAHATRVLPMLLAARERVIMGQGIPVEERAKLRAEIDSAAIAVESLLDPRTPPPKITAPAGGAPAAGTAAAVGGAPPPGAMTVPRS